MAYGKDRGFYAEQGPDHPVNKSRPELLDDATYWFEAFPALTFSRPAGMGGPLPIPITEIEAFCRVTDVPEPDRLPQSARIARTGSPGYPCVARPSSSGGPSASRW